jgi:hypothetical protein
MGGGGRPAPGRGVTARPALGEGGHRLDRRPECRGRGHRPGNPARSGGWRSSPGTTPPARQSSCRSRPRRFRCPRAGETLAVLLYRDSGPTLILDRRQQVEHEAYLTFMAGRAGVLVPEVLAVGRFGPSRDAALVTGLPVGPALSEADEDSLSDGILDELLLAVPLLRKAGIAHGTLGAETLIASAEGVCLRDFRCATSSAPMAASTVISRRRWPRWLCGWAPSARPPRRPGCLTPMQPAVPWCACSGRTGQVHPRLGEEAMACRQQDYSCPASQQHWDKRRVGTAHVGSYMGDPGREGRSP